ncbi:MAG: maleylpyruvate isomerase N-terminal domain-containing protein [Dehalococcoidia bacterium]
MAEHAAQRRRLTIVDEGSRRQLEAALAANREALLAIVSQVDEGALSLPTRNAEWSVRDVIGHVLASDADLIALLEAAGQTGATSVEGGSHEEHQLGMAGWSDATPDALVDALRERSERWRALLASLPDEAWALPSQAWWTPAARALAEIVDDYRTHDAEHGEDVKLALEGARRESAPADL